MSDIKKYCLTLLLTAFSHMSFGQIQESSKDSVSKFDYPRGIAFVGTENRVNSGEISKNSLRVQKGIDCIYVGESYHGLCRVSSYEILIIRNNCIVYTDSEKSAFFTDKMKRQFDDIKPGDRIVIFNIHARFPQGQQQLPSIVYQIK